MAHSLKGLTSSVIAASRLEHRAALRRDVADAARRALAKSTPPPTAAAAAAAAAGSAAAAAGSADAAAAAAAAGLSVSERRLRHARLTVHAVTVQHSTTSGEYVYTARLSCDDGNAATVEYQWEIRFTQHEFQQVFSPAATLRDKLKQAVEGLVLGGAGQRTPAARGRPTFRAAIADRLRRRVWQTLRAAAAAGALAAVSLPLQWFLTTAKAEMAENAARGAHDGLTGPEEELVDALLEHDVPPLWGIMLGVLAVGALLYWLWDTARGMLPAKILLGYHASNLDGVRRDLEALVADKERLRTDQEVATLLQFSPQALRHRLPDAVREGYLYCRFEPREDHDREHGGGGGGGGGGGWRGMTLELGLCRCTCDVGLRTHHTWHRRWAVLRTTGVSFFRAPFDKSPTHVLLFDAQFFTGRGRAQSPKLGDVKRVPTLVVGGSNVVAELALGSDHDARSWYQAVNFATNPSRSEWTNEHRFGSFAPRRLRDNRNVGVPKNQTPAGPPRARWFLNGRGYYACVARALREARREVFITGWFFTPSVLLTRTATGTAGEADLSIADALRAAAARGVVCYVLLYEEIPQALANNSRDAQRALQDLHPTNIHVLRHRSRFSKNVYWSHHEKTVTVDQSVAFVGGIDLALMRYDTWDHPLADHDPDPAKHVWRTNDYQNIRVVDFHDVQDTHKDVVDRSVMPRQPWRDIACQVWGAAATDVARHFVERWAHARRLTGSGSASGTWYDVIPALELQAPDRSVLVRPNQPAPAPPSPSTAAVLGELEARTPDGSPARMAPADAQALTGVQVLRSVGRWSCGSRHESSIHAAYCSLIENADRTLYIENQFFASGAAAGDSELGNRVAAALCTRLLRAVRDGETFRCVFVLPLLPGFANEIDQTSGKAGPLLTVMYYQYRTICRGGSSILGQLRAAIQQEVAAGRLPASAATDDYIRFFGLRNWAKLGGRCVTEDVYVHSKAMIVDDRATVIGSANLNDRSMLGNRDSEMCLCCEDDSGAFGGSMRRATMREFFGPGAGEELCDWEKDDVWARVGAIAAENTRLFRETLFPVPDDTVTTWTQLKALQAGRRFDVTTFPPDQLKGGGAGAEDGAAPAAAACEALLRQVRGVAVDFPLKFLGEEDLTPASLSAEGLAPAIFN